MYDVVSLGELLVDFTPIGESERGNRILEVNPGGAPCNVLAMLSKLGQKTAFIGKVGNDQFGNMLVNTLQNETIDTSGVILDSNYPTTLAFVHLDHIGDRSFSFYRNPGADCMLREEELDKVILQNTKVFHFGTLSMTNEPSKTATKKAIALAKNSGAMISFDPNLRMPLWKSEQEAKEAILYGMQQCDILKISDEEMEFILGISDVEEGTAILAKQYNIKLIFVTAGSKGSMFRYGNITGNKPAYENVKVSDTTGAGDCFCGAMLYRLLKAGFDGLNKEYLEESLNFANAAAALVVSKTGAMKAMPTMQEIMNLQALQ